RQVAEQLSPEQQVVTILCDTGTRYFSVTEYFQRESGPRPSALL
ncbi:MAG: cysteine synthase A, partial [Gemmatimonadetes bacterium]|nr:cysteine synthase A [Gemmatimonadota bacterium]